MWLRVWAMACSVAWRCCGRNWHSQTTRQCQPMRASWRCVSASRCWFRFTFFSQKGVFVLGKVHSLQPSCPCQKQPLTKMQVRYLRKTRSGCPGNRSELSLYLNPCAHKNLRTSNSGLVPFDLTEAMMR